MLYDISRNILNPLLHQIVEQDVFLIHPPMSVQHQSIVFKVFTEGSLDGVKQVYLASFKETYKNVGTQAPEKGDGALIFGNMMRIMKGEEGKYERRTG